MAAAPRAESAPGPLTARVMRAIEDRIDAGRLAPGARVASIRATAARMGVSNATVVAAYDRLVAQGALVARPSSGFRVADRPRPLRLAALALPEREPGADPLWVLRRSLDADGEALRPGCGWLPDDWLPVAALRRGLRGAARGAGASLTEYGTRLGHPPLREQLARRLAARGVEAGPNQVLLTDSGTQALDLVCRLLLSPGDAVLVDDPCYFNFPALARAHRALVVGVPMTPEGPDALAFARLAALHRPRLYVATAAIQNPTGASLAPATARALLAAAHAHGVVVVEDDIFADLEPEPAGPRLAALAGLEGAPPVIQVGSFSKTLSAAVRTGFVAARPDWVEAMADLKLATAFGNGELSARLVHGLLTDGSYRRHVAGLRDRLARAREEGAARIEAAGLRLWTEPRGGLFLWAELPGGLAAAPVAARAARRGVVLAPGDAFSVGGTAGACLRFNVARAPAEVFEVLAAAMEEAS